MQTYRENWIDRRLNLLWSTDFREAMNDHHYTILSLNCGDDPGTCPLSGHDQIMDRITRTLGRLLFYVPFRDTGRVSKDSFLELD